MYKNTIYEGVESDNTKIGHIIMIVWYINHFV